MLVSRPQPLGAWQEPAGVRAWRDTSPQAQNLMGSSVSASSMSTSMMSGYLSRTAARRPYPMGLGPLYRSVQMPCTGGARGFGVLVGVEGVIMVGGIAGGEGRLQPSCSALPCAQHACL